MITEVKDRKLTNRRDLNFEYDGKWVIFESEPSSTSGSTGWVVYYGDGTEEDWDALHQIIVNRYKGQALLTFAYAPKEDVVYGMYDIGVAARV
ncbi:MAG: hypothetical protein FWG77_02200 [Treponema sp.]|nr:hypothetical protein [Treponema sp.]